MATGRLGAVRVVDSSQMSFLAGSGFSQGPVLLSISKLKQIFSSALGNPPLCSAQLTDSIVPSWGMVNVSGRAQFPPFFSWTLTVQRRQETPWEPLPSPPVCLIYPWSSATAWDSDTRLTEGRAESEGRKKSTNYHREAKQMCGGGKQQQCQSRSEKNEKNCLFMGS